jgi:hypothetical protein
MGYTHSWGQSRDSNREEWTQIREDFEHSNPLISRSGGFCVSATTSPGLGNTRWIMLYFLVDDPIAGNRYSKHLG